MIILLCWLEIFKSDAVPVTSSTKLACLLLMGFVITINGVDSSERRLPNVQLQLDGKTSQTDGEHLLVDRRSLAEPTVAPGGGSIGLNFCAAPCACLDDYFECKRQNLRQVPPLPKWVQNLELTGNKLDDSVEDSIKDLSSLNILNLKKNHLTRIPQFHGLVSLEKLNLAHNRIQIISKEALLSLPSLREIDLGKNRIKSILPSSFPIGNQLNLLNLNGNQIDHILPGALDNLQNLVELHLSHNHLAELPHEVFKSLNVLKKLDMSYNSLNISWAIFKGLDQLRVLKIRANGIEHLPDGVFQALKSIAVIELDSNRITNLSRSGFFNLNTLTTLSLSNNTIRSLDVDTWEFIQQLTLLDLSANHLSAISGNNFKCLSKLRKLYLQYNQIKYFADKVFECLHNLEYLDLSGNHLSTTIEGIPGPFTTLTKLQTLQLKENDVKSINKNAFLGLDALVYLNLDGNDITTIQFNAFEPLKRLEKLVINSTHFVCDCNLQWLHNWLSAQKAEHHDAISDQVVVCSYPPEVQGRNLLSLREDQDFMCNESPKPRLIKEPSNQLAIKGTNVTLECTAISSVAEPMFFQWRRDNIDIKSNETETKIQELNNNTIMTSFFHLNDVNREHNGKYQCTVTNSFGSAYSQRFKITVASYPGFGRTPNNVTISAGNTARLDCSAYGEPIPQIAWQKDGGNDFPAARERRMHVMTADDAFFIINAKPSDMGVYTCTAENPAGIIKANATLTVHETPAFMKPTELRQEIIVGKSFVLDCFIRGSPRPELHWYKDDKMLHMKERFYFAADKQLLVVTDAEYADAGVYRCEIKNELGAAYRYLTVKMTKSISKAIVNGDEMTGIIIITIFCCTIATSIIWVVIIYHTKKGNECNNNNYVRNAIDMSVSPQITQSMNLQSRFLLQQQQQVANSMGNDDLAIDILHPLPNGSLPSNHKDIDYTSNKYSGTGVSMKISQSVDDVNTSDSHSNCNNNPTTDSYELATYNQKQQMVPLINSASQNQHASSPTSPSVSQPFPSSYVATSSFMKPRATSLRLGSSNSDDNSIKQASLRNNSENYHNHISNCNSPSCTMEQTLSLIRSNDRNIRNGCVRNDGIPISSNLSNNNSPSIATNGN